MEPPPRRRAGRRRRETHVARRFPAKLYDLVDGHSQVPEDEAIVTWCENGLAFILRDLNRFCEEVQPAHFCHNKWASFIRQLNLYGFRRITQGQSSGAYWHKFFQKGEPHLLRGIKRSRRQGSGAKKKQQQQEQERENHSTGRYATRQQDDLNAGWGSSQPPMHASVPLPPMSAVLPQLPPPPIISDEALLSELDGLVQAQKVCSGVPCLADGVALSLWRRRRRRRAPRLVREHWRRADTQRTCAQAQHGGQAAAAADAAAGHMRPPPARADSGGKLSGVTSGASLSRFLDSAPLNDGLRKRMASHQSIHSVGSAGQMADIGHQQRKQTAFQAGRRTTSKSSLASDDWDLNIADVDSLNLDDWRWSESQNGANLGAFGSRDFLRARGDQGLSVGGLSAGLPASDLPRSRSKEAITAIRPPADLSAAVAAAAVGSPPPAASVPSIPPADSFPAS